MYPQWNPGGTPWQGDAFSEGVDSFTGPGYGSLGAGRRSVGRDRYGAAIFVLPEIVVKGRGLYTGPAYSPLTDFYYPPDRTVNVAPSGGGRSPDDPASSKKAGSVKKKASASRGAFQDIVKGAWQRG